MPNALPIVQKPHKVLRAKAAAVPLEDIARPRIQRLISDMRKTLAVTPDGVGLAAPQVGESMRIFIVSEEVEAIDRDGHQHRAEDGTLIKPYQDKPWKYYVFINPLVKNISRKKHEDSEGCLSVRGTYGTVKRAEKITVEACDEHGKKFTRGASKFFARVLQHELDHLEGVLFIDKADRLEIIRS